MSGEGQHSNNENQEEIKRLLRRIKWFDLRIECWVVQI